MSRNPKFRHQYPDQRMEIILNEIKPTDRVLDVGCVDEDLRYSFGRGIWLHEFLRKRAASVIGVDIIKSEIKKLRDMGYSVIYADAETMQLGQKFDIIVAGELIEHLSNPGAFLDRAFEHLEEEGKLILTTPYPWSFVCFVGAILAKVPINKEHTCWFDSATLSQLLNRHGFSLDRFELIPLPARTKGWRISHLLCHLGFKRLGATGMVVICSRKRGQ